MRRVGVALLSAIVVGLMLAMPVSAGSRTVTFYDRQGDMGKPWYSSGFGSHDLMDPYSWFSGNCPIANAGYLDMLTGWVTVKGSTITMGLTLTSSVPTDGGLPEGVSEVRWLWAFYPSFDILPSPNYSNIYVVYLNWDGVDFSAVLVDRTNGVSPFPLTYLDFTVAGNTLTVTTTSSKIPTVAGWFCETIVCFGPPWPLDQYASMAGWFGPDMTDLQGPLATYWPWIAMP